MANITLKDITPIHFLETVRLLKLNEHKIYCTADSVEIRFQIKRFETPGDFNQRFDQFEHFREFIEQLKNSSVPTKTEDFIEQFFRQRTG
ncbi:hypothetical protein A1D23_13185 [Chelonobacter oris]|nr:hypothetical protein [Chelonobacter oris]